MRTSSNPVVDDKPAFLSVEKPTHVFTLVDQGVNAIAVIERFRLRLKEGQVAIEVQLFNTREEATSFFEGKDNVRSLVLLGNSMSKGCMKYSLTKEAQLPLWAKNAKWCAEVNNGTMSTARAANLADQLYADFVTNFDKRVSQGLLPWGVPRTIKPYRVSPRKNRRNRHWRW